MPLRLSPLPPCSATALRIFALLGPRARQGDGTACGQEKKIKELENYLMMQTSLVVELRSTASLPAAKLVAANINGPTRTPLRSDAPFATRRPLLGMIQEAHEAADETQMLSALKFAAAAAAALLVLVLLAFVSCQSGSVQTTKSSVNGPTCGLNGPRWQGLGCRVCASSK